MTSRGVKSYFRNTISFTLVFALICVGIIGSVWSKGVYKTRTENNTDEISSDKGYINALLLGVDKDGYRTDVIIFAQLNLINNSLSMLQIPRDTYSPLNKNDKKINSAYLGFKNGVITPDINQVYKEVESITGHEVNNYLMVNTKGFREIIDAIGGVDFDVPMRMKYDDPDQDLFIDLQKGMQHLNGSKAEQLVRFRKDNDGGGYPRGDLQRNEVQRDFIFAVIDKVFSLNGVTKIPELISIVSSSMKSSFTNTQMLQYAPFIMSLDKANIHIMGLEGVDEYRNGRSYFIPNDALNNEILSNYFVDESTVMDVSNTEIRRRDALMSDDGNKVVETDFEIESPSFFDRMFMNIQVIDGSDGTVDIDEIKSQIMAAGYNSPDVVETNLSYQGSRIICAEDDKNSHLIAKAMSFENFIVSPEKTGDYKIVIVVGKNWNG